MTADELSLIYSIINEDDSVVSTLEIGCAVGFSSMAILSALKGRSGSLHTIIDPFQTTQWDSAGLQLLAKNDLSAYTLIDRLSEFALPSLVESGKEFDFILIDGWHTFDHTLIDMFYSLRLLKGGGYLAVDDTSWPSVSRAIAYYENMGFLSLVAVCHNSGNRGKMFVKRALQRMFSPVLARSICQWVLPTAISTKINQSRYGSMVIFRKVGTDNRNWDGIKVFRDVYE